MASSHPAGNTAEKSLPPLTAGPHRSRLGLISIVACFGGLLFGYDTGVINGALNPMTEELGLTPFTEGVVTSSLVFAAAIGAIFCGRLSDSWGRRKTIIMLAVLFFLGTLVVVFTPNFEVLVVGRILLGLAVGGASTVVPVFLAELAPYEIRGSISGRNEAAIVIGQLSAFIINAILGNTLGHLDGVWRIMFAVCAIPAICLFFGMLRMPESPRWLVEKGRDAEALEVLKTVRSPERAEAELAQVEKVAIEEGNEKQVGFAAILKNKWLLRILLVGIGLGVAQQLTGINSIMFYGTQLLQNAGMSEDQAIVFNIGNGVLAVIGMYIGLRLIDKFPRRGMIQFGLVSVASLHLLIALLAAVLPDVEGSLVKPVLIMVVVVTFVAIMQACLGLVVWVVLSELFPLKARGVAIGFSVFWMWIANGTVALTFPSLLDAFGINGTFLLFGIVNFLSFLFVRNYLPETGSLSLEELEAKFESEGVKVER